MNHTKKFIQRLELDLDTCYSIPKNISINKVIEIMINKSCFNVTADSFKKITTTIENDYQNYKIYYLWLNQDSVMLEINMKDDK